MYYMNRLRSVDVCETIIVSTLKRALCTCLLRRERFLSTWHILAVGTIYLVAFFMICSDLVCARHARMLARVTGALCIETCWHYDRLRLSVPATPNGRKRKRKRWKEE